MKVHSTNERVIELTPKDIRIAIGFWLAAEHDIKDFDPTKIEFDIQAGTHEKDYDRDAYGGPPVGPEFRPVDTKFLGASYRDEKGI